MCSAWVTHMKYAWLNGSWEGFNPICEGRGSSKSSQPNAAELGKERVVEMGETENKVWSTGSVSHR